MARGETTRSAKKTYLDSTRGPKRSREEERAFVRQEQARIREEQRQEKARREEEERVERARTRRRLVAQRKKSVDTAKEQRIREGRISAGLPPAERAPDQRGITSFFTRCAEVIATGPGPVADHHDQEAPSLSDATPPFFPRCTKVVTIDSDPSDGSDDLHGTLSAASAFPRGHEPSSPFPTPPSAQPRPPAQTQQPPPESSEHLSDHPPSSDPATRAPGPSHEQPDPRPTAESPGGSDIPVRDMIHGEPPPFSPGAIFANSSQSRLGANNRSPLHRSAFDMPIGTPYKASPSPSISPGTTHPTHGPQSPPSLPPMPALSQVRNACTSNDYGINDLLSDELLQLPVPVTAAKAAATSGFESAT